MVNTGRSAFSIIMIANILYVGTVATYSTQIMATAGVSCLEIHSYVRGYHAYKNVWEPARGEALLVRWEPTNPLDKHAVAVYKEDIVGHVPYNLAPRLSQFLKRECNKAFAEITVAKVNRGAGYGLEVPCVYRLYGLKLYIAKMQELLDSLGVSGHI